MTMSSYVYTPLPADPSHSIRLLRVHESLSDGLISCDLGLATTDANYTCLSYTWGPVDNQQEILINGSKFNIRCSLWQFLDMARHNYAGTELWIDAVCINQADDVERARQVQMMMDIYGSGRQTLIWLGNPLHDYRSSQQTVASTNSTGVLTNVSSWFEYSTNTFLNSEALQNINPFDEDSNVIVGSGGLWTLGTRDEDRRAPCIHLLQTLAQDDKLASVWFLIQNLPWHIYWTRMWIIQEIYSSKKGLDLIYGNMLIGAREFFSTLKAFRGLGTTLTYGPTIRSGKECQHTRICPKDEYHRTLLGVAPLTTAVKQVTSSASLAILNPSEAVMLHTVLVDLRTIEDDCIADQLGGQWLSPRYKLGQLDLWKLLSAYQTSQCRVRNDKVFALAGLCSKTHPIRVDYSLSSCELYYQICESTHIDGGHIKLVMGSLRQSLRISLLDFLIMDRRTFAKKPVHESCVKAGAKISRSTMLYSGKLRPSAHETKTYEVLFLRGYCDHCSRPVDFDYLGPRASCDMKLGAVFIQCFGKIHVAMSLDYHQKLGYEVLLFKQVDWRVPNWKYDPPPRSRQLWSSETSDERVALSSVLKEAVALHKLLLDVQADRADRIVLKDTVSAGESAIDHLISRFSGCEAFAASRKISAGTLSKILEPDLARQVTQYLEVEARNESKMSSFN